MTVDHRLRPEAADEARFVACACARIGVPHETLAWEHGEIGGNLQDRARRARYALIADWARRGGIGDVVLGHTADDQAETVLMGLAREAYQLHFTLPSSPSYWLRRRPWASGA